MINNQRVITQFGPGTVLFQEGKTGIFSHRYCVELDNVPHGLINLQLKYGGVFCYECNMKVIEPAPDKDKTVEQLPFDSWGG